MQIYAIELLILAGVNGFRRLVETCRGENGRFKRVKGLEVGKFSDNEGEDIRR
jgi:hypothetical protein